MSYNCRCGGELGLEFRDEHTGGILIKDESTNISLLEVWRGVVSAGNPKND